MIRACSRLAGMLRMIVPAALLLVTLPARAYDPATTHAGLTEQAVLASELHRVLAHRLSRPLGLFEPSSSTAPTSTPPRRASSAAASTRSTRLAATVPAPTGRPRRWPGWWPAR